MADYDRKFNAGRGSEQLLNEELHKVFEALRHIVDIPPSALAEPDSKLHGSLWLDQLRNELKYYNKPSDKFELVFKDKFRLVDELLSPTEPLNPVLGQLWLYNGVLMYYDSSGWAPVKALTEDSDLINIAAFESFLMLSPLKPKGDVCIPITKDMDYEQYLDDILDPAHDAYFATPTPPATTPDTCVKTCDVCKGPTPPAPIADSARTQFLVPNEKAGRFFIDRTYKKDYEKINAACIQYPTKKLVDHVPSWIHVNPGKLTGITKRLVKIDKNNTLIQISPDHTEYYGFKNGVVGGEFLRPGKNALDGDYIPVPGGIQLNYDAGQHFDYVLAIHYDFSWIRSSGVLSYRDNHTHNTSFFLSEHEGPMNVFVQGLDLEHNFYDYDGLSETLTILDDTSGLEVSVMKNPQREYGVIKERDPRGWGIIKLFSKFENPLVFVNGEALHSVFGDVEFDHDRIYVNGGQPNMCWCVMELKDVIKMDDMFYHADFVPADGLVHYNTSLITVADDMVLFVDGLLTKKESLVIDRAAGTVTVAGLAPGQEYILLKDRYHNLYDETKLSPALATGKADESLVYLNGRLLGNDTAIVSTETEAVAGLTAANDEIKLFIASDIDRLTGNWRIWDSFNKTWLTLDALSIAGIKGFIYSYENTIRAIKINVPYTMADQLDVYAYNFANTIDNPLIIRSLIAHDENDFTITNTFLPGTNSLSVYVDGLRQFHVDEKLTGDGFVLPKKVTGRITYVIELPHKGASQTCQREIVTKDNAIEGSINAYRTKLPMYPGSVSIFVDGVRQDYDAFTIIDNYTFMIMDSKRKMIGNSNTFPIEKKERPDGKFVDVPRRQPTEILVEVTQDFSWKEKAFEFNNPGYWRLFPYDYGIPLDILESNDEIVLYFDGLFTGMRTEVDYKKNRAGLSIDISNPSAVEALSLDRIAKHFLLHPDKALLYKAKYGHDYVPKTNHKILMRWR